MRPLALTMGDPAGIGGEITAKAWHARHATGPVFCALDDPSRLAALGVPVREIAAPEQAASVFARALPVLPVRLRAPAVPGQPDALNATAVIEAFGGEARKNFLASSSLLNSLEFLERGIQIVILGDRADKHTQKLLQAVYSQPVPDRCVMVIAPGTELPKNHPARNKTRRDDRATAYICRGPSCSMPLTDPGMLADAIDPRKAVK